MVRDPELVFENLNKRSRGMIFRECFSFFSDVFVHHGLDISAKEDYDGTVFIDSYTGLDGARRDHILCQR
ncbi:MAG: hypothetical protein IJ079_11215 [Lachnospiraceae bacterium]|nr:hypothetical protein [Lachnospiraceae bacterium]